ncbi:MAG: hypothetical protein AB7Y46_03255 [Armatimonadota bacterium]
MSCQCSLPAPIAIASLLALGALSQPASAQENLLANPSFEEIDENGFPAGWARYGGGVPESVVEMTDDAHSGQRAVRLLDTGPEERDQRYSIGVTQNVPIEGGRAYILSVWAKAIARNHDGAMNLQLRFQPGDRLTNVTVTPPVGGDWERTVVAGQAPEDATSATVYIYTMHFWTTETLIDDASLIAVDREALGVRFPLAAHGSMGIETVRPLNLRTPIVAGGQPAAVIAIPTDVTGALDEQYAALGGRLAAGIEARTGVRLPVTADARSLVGREGTIIALGNLNNNFVIERLYFNKYLEIDALRPGAGRYVLQTVHEPYNWPRGVNVLVVGASDLDGLSAGVDALLARVPAGNEWVLSAPLLEVSGVELMSEEQAQALVDSPVSQDVTRDFWSAAQQYRDTGDIAWARRAKRILLVEAAQRFERDPHFHITWPEETTSNMIGAMWDVLEEAPVWTDEERLAATNVILNTLYVLPARTSGYGGLENNDGIIWNHTTFPLLGIYWMARYFERYYGNVDGQMALMLRKCAACFLNQVKSWKPQEDSAGYEAIVPRHTIDYTLAENNYAYFENGNVLRHAEYEVAICDNTGDVAGFGDSGYGHGVYLNNQHWPLFYYRDGRFLWWLNRVVEGGYRSPYDPSIQPVEWTDLVGATVFELHPEVYRYTTEQADYGGEPTPPNIPLERCFDKIAFRESLDMDAEYFLLDGYSRGKHLQYDGNAIIKFFADGHDWLIDGDYLVRNTTDHNGVSVIRGGRVAELIPSCVSLEAIADLPTATLCETVVYDFNGVDWLRNIFWLKGEFVLVIDRMRAREADEYTFVGNWKMLAEGEQTLEEGRTFRTVRQGAGGVGNRDLVVVPNPAEGVARAVRFTSQVAQLDTVLELPAGNLELTLFAQGLDSGTDSFFVSVDGGETIPFHIPVGSFGPSSSTWEKDTPTPNIQIAEAGAHRITITLREGPGVMLDRMVLRDAAGNVVAEVEAESAPPVPDELVAAAPAQRFVITTDGQAASKLTGRINHVGLGITYMRQRLSGALAAGEQMAFHSIFFNDDTDAPKSYGLRRISDEAALVTRDGEPWLVVLVGQEATMGGQAQAKMLAFTRDRAWAADVTDFRGQLSAERPVSGELQSNPPYVTVIGPEELRTVMAAGMPLMLQGGRLEMDLAGFGELTAAMVELEQAFNRYVARARAEGQAAAPPAPEAPTLAAEWVAQVDVQPGTQSRPIEKLYALDLDGDGVHEVVALRGTMAHALSAEGEPLWSYETGGATRCVVMGEIDGDGAPELLIGSDDEHIHVLDARTGQLERTHHCDIPLRVGTSSVRQPRVGALALGDLEGDGRPDIIAGLMNANIVRYDADFNLIWRYDSQEHGTLEFELVDLDGDGRLEIVAGNRYGAVKIFDADGRAIGRTYSELGDVAMAVGDLEGDGTLEVANGSSTGAFSCDVWSGGKRFEFPNYGFAFTEVLMADLNGDGADELIAASETGYVYILGAEGQVLAQRDFRDKVNDVTVLPRPGAAPLLGVACDDGRVYLIDAQAELVGVFGTGGRPLLVEALPRADGPGLLAATVDTVHLIVP